MNNIKFQIGQKVKITILELEGYVVSILIKKDNYITYEVSFFSNGEKNNIFFEDFEIEELEKSKQKG